MDCTHKRSFWNICFSFSWDIKLSAILRCHTRDCLTTLEFYLIFPIIFVVFFPCSLCKLDGETSAQDPYWLNRFLSKHLFNLYYTIVVIIEISYKVFLIRS